MTKIKKISEGSTLFWILELYIPQYQIAMGSVDFKGYILATSTQVWNLITTHEKEEEAFMRSCLIGPSVFYGYTSRGIRKVKTISGVIFDSTELRPDKPIPLLDVVNPIVIDPMATPDEENDHQIPSESIGYFTKKTIEDTSGVGKAKAYLQGRHRDKYKIFINGIDSGVYHFPERLPILDVSQKKLMNLDKENLAQYIIVELNPIFNPDINTLSQFVEVYNETLEYMLSAKEHYFFL
ncbi:MAG: hypothetical protein ACFFCD_09775 [Promethearchaeota archaeon]